MSEKFLTKSGRIVDKKPFKRDRHTFQLAQKYRAGEKLTQRQTRLAVQHIRSLKQKPTTEDLDVAQFGRVIHKRP